jgi:hypothetical protein
MIDPGAGRLRDTAAAWVKRDGYRHYTPGWADEVQVGWAELLHDAEVAQRLLDLVDVPDGDPQGGGDIDTRVAALALRVTDAEARLAEIADIHARETAPGGMVGDYCVECEHRWPCPTYEKSRPLDTEVTAS